MIEQVLNEIKAAEQQAAAIIAAANETAREISLSTASECDALRARFDADIKREVKAILAEAEKVADKEAADTMREAETAAAALVRAAERNVRSAAEWIADLIVKGNY